jgi:hypothetical protein
LGRYLEGSGGVRRAQQLRAERESLESRGRARPVADARRQRRGQLGREHRPRTLAQPLQGRVRVKIMGSQNYEKVGESQPLLIMNDPMISTRAVRGRIAAAAAPREDMRAMHGRGEQQPVRWVRARVEIIMGSIITRSG